MDLIAEFHSRFAGTHDEQGGVVAGQTAHQILDVHSVDGRTGRRRQAGHGLDDHDILRHIKGRDALLENGAQPARHVEGHLPLRHRVAIGAVARQLLDKVQLLDVPGNGGLGGLHPTLPQFGQKLVLGLHLMLLYDAQNLLLTLFFHLGNSHPS